MRRFAWTSAVVVLGLLVTPRCARGELRAYLQVDFIRGSATSQEHRDWSEILQYHISFHGSGFATGGSAGSEGLVASPMYVSKLTDNASPGLLLSTLEGRHHPRAKIDLAFVSEGQEIPYVQWQLDDVMIITFNTKWDVESYEQVTLDYRQLTYRYNRPETPDVDWIEVTYDRETGAATFPESLPSGFALHTLYDSAGAPEPTTATLLTAAMACLAVRRARRGPPS